MVFEEQFDDLAVLAYRTAFRVLGSRPESEEVAQETMTKALLRWNRIDSHARPWVCRVAANEAIGILRKRRRGRPELAIVQPSGDASVDRIDLQRALLTLSKRQREVLILRYLVDLPEADVGAELGISIGAVKTHAHRALAALRTFMSADPDIDPKATCDV
jgi:RNA polymerase sigma-70 factor (ECF subfamily)